MSEEILEYFDDHNQLLETATRSEVYARGLNHRAAHVIIMNPQGRFLVQQRATHKSTWADAYDLSSAETAKPGEEGEQTARRGLREELALTRDIPLLRLHDWKFHDYTPEDVPWRVRGFVRLFLGISEENVSLDPEEVQWYDWLAPEEIDVLLVDLRVQVTPWFKTDWRFLRENFDAYMREIRASQF